MPKRSCLTWVQFPPSPPFTKRKEEKNSMLFKGFGVQIWQGIKWKKPEFINNFFIEVDFGKFSIFLGKGKNFSEISS